MKSPFKCLILIAVFFLVFTNHASAAFHFDDKNFGSFGDHHDIGDHHHHHHHSGPGGDKGWHEGVAPEPVSPVLFLFGAGVLALSYSRRKQLAVA